ncbi:dipeptidase [Sphaerisporangium siamense]|uniref:Acetylornithine deacetylase/succinyl-diaminopimelate desuccinylase-like protein n=1 Tax=Sphaerisporangium siamense TaxID=795645 RepID=A0A7W7DFZ5_9ACTN|nr:M20/M25/M40 family metallo-hydrolase [Sphaerisporangium siamense]MBB4705784.1 acetylornithine deacetylase/succinyl-diaminopimelate desuccinylase-like protein [Sphaerisporangium siamense]GII82829.1 dipeptidase [Sphaerisporangium siamense]
MTPEETGTGNTGASEAFHYLEAIEKSITAQMPRAVDELMRLVSIPSVAFPGHPEEPVLAAAAATEELLRSTGLPHVRQIPVEGSFPAVYAEAPAPPGTPTVLLYAHYDVQPAGDPALWRTPPFEPTLIDGRLYGRGAADDKSGIMAHVLALRAFQGRFPVGIKVIIEGQEEYAGERLEEFVERNPDLLRADAIIVADVGNPTVGDPAVTTSLRGLAAFTIEVRALKESLHSGSFGGAAPDALAALIRMLATLHDDRGDVRVPGLPRGIFPGAGPDEGSFRHAAGVLDGAALVGSGSLADRLWSSYAITVTGLDVPSVNGAINAVQAVARARVTVRVPPAGDPGKAAADVLDYLRTVAPWGVQVSVTDQVLGSGYLADGGGRARTALNRALERAYGRAPRDIGAGGSIPLVSTLAKQFPAAEILLFGAEDEAAAIHAPNERLVLDELRRTAIAEALFLADYAAF